MKSSTAIFLLGALVGAALALGCRAAILNLDDGNGSGHGDHASQEDHSAHDGMDMPKAQPEHSEHGAGMPAKPEVAPASAGFLIDLGNEKCPIMGNGVNGKTWSEWNGLRIGHCCPPCIKKLLAAPEKALDDAGIEWREAAELVAKVNASTGDERKKLLSEAEEKYGVVRMPEGAE